MLSMNKVTAFSGIIFLLACFVLGCAEITPKDTFSAVTHPLGLGTDSSLKPGMSKNEILASWGTPDYKNDLGTNELGAQKEEWVYKGEYRGVPMDVKYWHKTKHLFFEGNVLTKWSVDQ